MIKKIAAFLLGLLATGTTIANATETFTLGACDHKIAGSNGYGSDNAGEISAALYVPASKLQTLAGNSISRVDVGLISRINVRDMTVWIRKQLDSDNLATSFIERGNLGWNEVTFTEPYVIEENCPGLYIGFTYANAGSSHPVSFIGDSGDYTSWFRSKATEDWQDMTSKGALSLEVIVTGDNLPQYDLSLLSCNVAPNPLAGDNIYTISGEISNEALKPISGFSVKANDNNGEGPERDVKVSVLPGEKARFSLDYPMEAPLSGEVVVTITRLADGPDANSANNTIVTRVAFPRNVLFEEFTTELCVNCPGAAEMVHNVMTRHDNYDGRVVSVCHHSGFGTDRFTRDCDTDLLWLYDLDGKAFAPAAMFDRQPIFKRGLNMDRFEPIVAIRSEKDIEECIAEAMNIAPHAMVAVKVISSDETSATVEVKIVTDNEFNLNSPMLTFYTLEDNVKANRQAGAEDSFIHMHVIRTDNGAWGEPVEIEDNTFSKIFNIELDPEWKRADLGFAAFVSERDEENVGNNIVENSAYVPLIATDLSVFNMKPGDNVSSYPAAIYDLNGKPATEKTDGVLIMIMSDGSVRKIINLPINTK